jgi:glycosyltransferase involved in cell wall biosynthesis
VSAPRSHAIAVAIPTGDRPAALRRLLAAVLAGDRLPDEVVIVDHGDASVTSAVVDEIAADGIVVRHVPAPGGSLSRSRNVAMTEASTPLVAFIDDDCVPTPGWLRSIASAFDGDAGLAAVTGPVLPLPADRPGLYPVSSRRASEQRCFSGDVLPWDVGTGGNLAVRRQALHADRALFDLRLGAGSAGRAGEDLDVLRRILRAGHTVLYASEAVVLHEQQTLDRRIRSRFGYGHGVGAAVGLWVRALDPFAPRMLGAWLTMRGRRLVVALVNRDRLGSREELLMLAGTARGLWYGARARRERQS